MKNSDNNRSFLYRFYIYQNERFPFIVHGILISVFTFSAISYSRLCRGLETFISGKDFVIGIFATITLFFLVRIFDEFKDKEEDALFRKYLPVPRGLVSLNELKIVGIIVAVIQISLILFFQSSMIWLYMIILGYLVLMGVEFFISDWLKPRQMMYILSHMFIIPLVDLYASGLDWSLEGDSPHLGLVYFFVVSYLNGVVLEFGRKIRAPHAEEEGVVSYTNLYGTQGGVIRWLGLLLATFIVGLAAMYYAKFEMYSYIMLSISFMISAIPGLLFLKNPTIKMSKMVEYGSALWTILLYLSLGGIPMIIHLFF